MTSLATNLDLSEHLTVAVMLGQEKCQEKCSVVIKAQVQGHDTPRGPLYLLVSFYDLKNIS